MKKNTIKKTIALCMTLCLLFCGLSTAFADSTPLVYKVTDQNGNHIYLLGTIHVGRDSMFPIAGFDDVLSDCDAVALEIYTDDYFPKEGEEPDISLSDLFQFFTMIDLTGCSLEQDLMDKLSALPGMEDYADLLPFLSLSAVSDLVMGVSMIEAADVDADKSVENYVVNAAREHGLELFGLETSEEQDAIINSQSDAMILAELEDIAENYDWQIEELNRMLQAWAAGDRAVFVEAEEAPADEELAAEWEEFNQRLTDDRNIGFLEDAEGFLKEGRKVLIAIGADHIYGINGLVDLLAARGYQVEELGGRA